MEDKVKIASGRPISTKKEISHIALPYSEILLTILCIMTGIIYTKTEKHIFYCVNFSSC